MNSSEYHSDAIDEQAGSATGAACSIPPALLLWCRTEGFVCLQRVAKALLYMTSGYADDPARCTTRPPLPARFPYSNICLLPLHAHQAHSAAPRRAAALRAVC